MKKLKRKYKLASGVQQISMDTPDYSDAYTFKEEQNAKTQMGKNLGKTGLDIAGTAIGVPGLGGIAEGVGELSNAVFKDAKGNYKNKTSELLANQLNPLERIGKGFSFLTGDKSAGADLWSGSLIGTGLEKFGMKNPFGKTSEQIGKEKVEQAKKENTIANYNKNRYSESATGAQAALAKKGKYKVKTKQPRLIETEGREPIFSPKKADGTRDLLYYNPNDPTHEEGGVKAVVMPKNRYNNGASNLMPRRSKVSLLGSGIMAVGAKQLKVNDLNNTAFSNNLANTPSANAANAFIQPTAGINQVARQIPQERRQETKRTIRSHKKVNPDLNKIVDPPTPIELKAPITPSGFNKQSLYETKLPKPRSTFNTKNDFKKGGKYIKTYQDGTQAAATYKHTKTFKSKPAYQAALQAHDDSLNLYGQSRYFTDKVKESGLYNSTVENPEVRNITRTGTGKTHSPLKAYGAPNDSSEDVMTIAGMNPMRKDLYSRKENKYKSFKEYDEAKATGNPEKHEGYEINMYKHPEMALNFKADTAETIQPRKTKFKTSSDSTVNRTPVRTITTPTKETVADTTKIKTTPVANKPVTTRGKFVGREKTLLDKAGEFLNKVGSSKRMSNGKSVRVFK